MATTSKRRTPKVTELASAHFTAEINDIARHIQPHYGDPTLFRNAWRPGTLPEMFTKSRALLRDNDYWGGIHKIRLTYFGDDIRFLNADKNVLKWKDRADASGLDLSRLELDIWTEFLMCDNAIVFWREPERGQFAVPVVLDCELCTYSDALGASSLKVKPIRQTLTPAQKKALGPRWSVALEQGKAITLDPEQGEYFKVLTWGKRGGGLGYPTLGQILDKLGFRELLEIADFAAGWEHGDIAKHIKKGHPIPSGERAGRPDHFITKAQSDAILKNVKGKRGARTIVSNFDLSMAYVYLDPRFFDAAKYDGVMKKLKVWAGAPGLIYESGQVSGQLMSAFAAEGRRVRGMVGAFIDSILGDETFNGGVTSSSPLHVGWNPQSFLDYKMMLEWVRAGYSNGLISPQTARHALGVDPDRESKLMKEAHKAPDGYRPVFEAKQGLVRNPGRPSDKPDAQTSLPGQTE